jgi:murein L,D-transpeptidase YcbB/YkuD
MPAGRIARRVSRWALLGVGVAILTCGRVLGQAAGDADAAVVPLLRERLQRMQAKGAAGSSSEVAARTAMPKIYEPGGDRPLWDPEKLDTLLALIRASAEDGLRPEDYHLEALTQRAKAVAPGADPAARADADLLATDAFCLLLYHLYFGKVDPKSLDPNWNFAPRPIGDRGGADFVRDALTQNQLREAVARVRPEHWWYAKARAALAQYRALAEKGGWPPISPGPALKLGAKGPRVVELRRRLAATGELSNQPVDGEDYDAPLAAAVKDFQTRHRMTSDGAVAAETLAELNVPVEARVRQIRINLERARWVLHEITPGDLVIVDVAGFDVIFARGGDEIWRSKIQVGKPYRQTPIFKSAIDQVVFNPTWTVPPGILANDMLPAIKKDRGYLQKKGLEVVDRDGKTVDPSSIDWAKQTASTFPYMLRQGAGPDNALGRVKILFPNPHLVYLHDTPSKALFEKDARAFSSGCMRVQRPLELAGLVLNDPKTWSAAAMDAVVASGETKTVRVERPIPVLIVYWTIDPRVEGRTVFKRDPYGRDPKLAAALDAAFGQPAR